MIWSQDALKIVFAGAVQRGPADGKNLWGVGQEARRLVRKKHEPKPALGTCALKQA